MTVRPLLIAGVLLSGAALAGANDVPAAARALGFGEGERPVRTGLARGDELGTAQRCGECHDEVYARWRVSGHGSAWDNPVFQAGFLREPVERCVHCHAPRDAQRAEVARAMPRADLFATRAELLSRGSLPLPSRALAHDGIDCQGCHVRDGEVWTATDVGVDGHVQRPETAKLGSPGFCAGCHEFQFHEFRHGRMVLTGTKIQSTFTEWRDWGGKRTCLDCHADGDPHALKGTRDLEFLRGALRISVSAGALLLRSQGVGHHFPTGDLFRHLTVEVFDGKRWSRVAYIGRRYESRPDPAIGGMSMALVSDTSLVPGVPRELALPPGARRYRVTYHYVSELSEERGDVAPERARVVLLEADLRAPREGRMPAAR